MEIEKKFLVHISNIELNNYEYRIIEQGYLSTSPVVRVRRDNDDYYLTYKSSGLMVRQEVNLPLTKESYMHLIKKSDGNVISKRRYLIPYQYVPGNSSLEASSLVTCTIELDVFEGDLSGLIIAEVEFPSIQAANSFVAPDWFTKDVTSDPRYQNSNMINGDLPQNDEMC